MTDYTSWIRNCPVSVICLDIGVMTISHTWTLQPVMDFRELNSYIESHTADADVCSQKLREWRRQGVDVALIDLKKAYLQIRIDKSLWPY
ncbi:hypothetical protein T08_4308 [Trichinella sp. T8]|nr:hypothetical protein T08_4308 [Trichinella sp. T8]